MSATIYHLSDYARLRRRRQCAPAVGDDHRQQAIVTFGVLIFAVVLIVVGVLLIDGIAAVGRGNNDCLQGGRRVCGLFHSAFIPDRLQRHGSRRGVAERSHMPFIKRICAPLEAAVSGVSSNLTTGLSAYSRSPATARRAFVESRRNRGGTRDPRWA